MRLLTSSVAVSALTLQLCFATLIGSSKEACLGNAEENAQASAMLQVRSASRPQRNVADAEASARLQVHSQPSDRWVFQEDPDTPSYAKPRCVSAFMDSEVPMEEAKRCLPDGLLTKYLAQKEETMLQTKVNASRGILPLLKSGDTIKLKTSDTVNATIDGSNAPITAEGFKAVTSLCCPPEMETFFGRLLISMGLDVCSKPHVQGLMHWFSCVPDLDYQYLIDVINNGNPCKYWATAGDTCPTLSAGCMGKWCR